MALVDKVDRGAMLLDALEPGWEQQINVDELDLMHDQDCVLGQLYESYANGLENLGPIVQEYPVEFGFTKAAGSQRGFATLTRLWKKSIEERVAA